MFSLTSIRFARLGIGIFLTLLPHVVYGGNYSQNFSSFSVGQTDLGDGTTLVSTESGYANAHIEDSTLKEMQLSAWNIHNDSAAFLLPDLDPGNRIYSFSASWISPVYGNFPAAGEGFSFSFGPVRSLNLVSGSVESGYGVGLCFSVKTGTNNPGFYLLQDGNVIASRTNNPAVDWGNFSNTRHAFQVNWDNDTGLTVLWNGSAIFTNVSTGSYAPTAGDSFVWAARVSDFASTYRIDNVSVSTVTQAAPTLRAVTASNYFSPFQVVSADVNTRGLDTTVTFEFGTNTSYGMSAMKSLAAASGLNVGVTNQFAFDTDRTIPLHARVTASNALGSVTSSDMLFFPAPFELRSPWGVSQAGGSGAVWADINDDGMLDLMVHGRWDNNASAKFYINRGNAPWTVPSTFIGFTHSFASVGDFDNDNRPDVLWTGGNGSSDGAVDIVGGISHALITYGVASNQLSQLGLPAQVLMFPFYYDMSHSLVLDLDHDGRQDILVTGVMQPDYSGFTNTPDPLVVGDTVGRLLRNEFPGTRPGDYHQSYFRLMTTPLPGLGALASGNGDCGYISSGNLDGDGFPDIYTYGIAGSNPLQNLGWEMFRSDGEMGLVETQKGNRQLGNTLYSASCSVWADLNGDGLDDLVIAEGESAYNFGTKSHPIVQIFYNDGQGHLTNSGPPLEPMGWANLAVGDIFNHGRNDIIVFGVDPMDSDFHSSMLIFRNEGNGVFTRLDYGFPMFGDASFEGESLQLADYDRDGRLDFCRISTGAGVSDAASLDGMAVLFRNEMDIVSNAPPQAPTNLSTVVGPGTVTFHWGNATDDITPANLLTYNLRVGTNSLGASVVSPLANVTNGWRKIAAPGNCRHTFSALYRFPPGTYYWSVQAVDGGFAGGAWAPEQSFTITEPERPTLNINASTNQSTQYWPARFPDYTLQQTPSLNVPNWTAVTNAPYYDNGKIKVATTNAFPASFYRLSKP